MTVVILALALPALLAIAYVGLRRAQSAPMVRSLALAKGTDTRGIALQTVIIIVVLLAIAGAVAGVLITRGTEATNQLEDTDVVRDAREYGSFTLCEAAGFQPKKGGDPTTDGTHGSTTNDRDDFTHCDPE
jgi:hypothetical protein